MDFVSSNIDFLHKSCEDVLPSSAQAQAQLEAELVLILISPAPTHPPTHPPVQTSSKTVGNQQNLLSNDCSTIPVCSKIVISL